MYWPNGIFSFIEEHNDKQTEKQLNGFKAFIIVNENISKYTLEINQVLGKRDRISQNLQELGKDQVRMFAIKRVMCYVSIANMWPKEIIYSYCFVQNILDSYKLYTFYNNIYNDIDILYTYVVYCCLRLRYKGNSRNTVDSQQNMDVKEFIYIMKQLNDVIDFGQIGDQCSIFGQLRNLQHVQKYHYGKISEIIDEVKQWVEPHNNDIVDRVDNQIIIQCINDELNEQYDFNKIVSDEYLINLFRFTTSGKALGLSITKTQYYANNSIDDKWLKFVDQQLKDKTSEVLFKAFVKPEQQKMRPVISCDNITHFQLSIFVNYMKQISITRDYYNNLGPIGQISLLNQLESQHGVIMQSLGQRRFDQHVS